MAPLTTKRKAIASTAFGSMTSTPAPKTDAGAAKPAGKGKRKATMKRS